MWWGVVFAHIPYPIFAGFVAVEAATAAEANYNATTENPIHELTILLCYILAPCVTMPSCKTY